jgi:hypothetical protein
MDQTRNYSEAVQQCLCDMRLGMRVDRPAELIPQTAHPTYFTIYVGKILMTLLIGEVTVSIGNATNMLFRHDPDTGTTAGLGANLAVGAFDAGDIITLPGLFSNALLPAAHAGSVSVMSPLGVVLTPGIIECVTSGNSGTGIMKWSLFYVPLDDGAYVTVA